MDYPNEWGVSRANPERTIAELKAEVERLKTAHEGLLNTLEACPSRSSWVQWVYRNAKAHYDTLTLTGGRE